MTAPYAEDARPEPPQTGDEFATLTGFLDFHRATLEWKCSGLTPQQLGERAVPPSSMSLLGLVRHLTDVERAWFDRVATGTRRENLFSTPDDPDLDFTGARPDEAAVDEAFAAWRTAIEESRAVAARVVASPAGLDSTFEHPVWGTMSLRWVLTHMVEEYARHNGHADLLRERIDGATGE